MANNEFIELLFGIARSFVNATNKNVEEYNKKTERDVNNYTRRYSNRSTEELKEILNNKKPLKVAFVFKKIFCIFVI